MRVVGYGDQFYAGINQSGRFVVLMIFPSFAEAFRAYVFYSFAQCVLVFPEEMVDGCFQSAQSMFGADAGNPRNIQPNQIDAGQRRVYLFIPPPR